MLRKITLYPNTVRLYVASPNMLPRNVIIIFFAHGQIMCNANNFGLLLISVSGFSVSVKYFNPGHFLWRRWQYWTLRLASKAPGNSRPHLFAQFKAVKERSMQVPIRAWCSFKQNVICRKLGGLSLHLPEMRVFTSSAVQFLALLWIRLQLCR